MSAQIQVDRWPYNRLRRFAEDYLSRVHPSGGTPIPIDEFLDHPHGIDIVPVEGLYETTVLSYTAKDMKTIYIDKRIFVSRNPYRYRFCVAHELAHVLIHRQVYEAADFGDVESWKRFLASIPDDDYAWFENQAYNLAGLLLVPPKPLEVEYLTVVDKLRNIGFDIDDMTPPAMKMLVNSIGKRFSVSRFVINKRARRDGLWNWDEDLID